MGEGEGEDDSVVAVSSYRRIVVSSSRRPEVGGDEEEERGRGRGRGRGRQRRHGRRVVVRAGHWRRHDVAEIREIRARVRVVGAEHSARVQR